MLNHDIPLAWLGRRKTLFAYTLVFVVGAVRGFVLTSTLTA
jgi:hypothetical protein